MQVGEYADACTDGNVAAKYTRHMLAQLPAEKNYFLPDSTGTSRLPFLLLVATPAPSLKVKVLVVKEQRFHSLTLYSTSALKT